MRYILEGLGRIIFLTDLALVFIETSLILLVPRDKLDT